jgi:hypothetical protein
VLDASGKELKSTGKREKEEKENETEKINVRRLQGSNRCSRSPPDGIKDTIALPNLPM